jgi:tellurite resistance protein TerC
VENWVVWVVFSIIITIMLVLDLGVFHKNTHEIKMKEALTWSAVWIALAMVFNIGIYFYLGSKPALEFFAGYILEKSLSVDNIFVFILIFSSMKVPKIYQHRILFWGVIGAIIMRAVFIGVGVTLMEKFHWITYVFGALLVITGIKMVIPKDESMDPNNDFTINLVKKFIPITDGYRGDRFFTKENGKLFATPLFLVLILIESSDVIFAVDSIPAILAITNDTLILFTSNIFAILGLRSLYFALGGLMDQFRYLKYALAAILTFVGIKMLIVNYYKVPIGLSLSIIGSLLVISMILSHYIRPKESKE